VKTFFLGILVIALAGLCSCATTVTPPLPRNVRIDPDPVEFGPVFVGDAKNMPAVVTNNTAAPLNVAASTVQAGTAFSPGVTPALPANVLPNGGALPFRFDFKPMDVGDFTAKWTVKIDGTDYTLDLRGKGVGVEHLGQRIGFNSQDAWVSDPNGIDFGSILVGQVKKGRLELVRGGQDLTIKIPPTITDFPGNPAAGAFKLRKPTAPPASLTLVDPATTNPLGPNDRRTIGTEVSFRPPRVGSYKATLTISDPNGNTVMRILLKGVGISGD
jgi:hypothetical protein